MSYVKFISATEIEFPPINKDGIINYNTNEEMLIRDGYKVLVEVVKPVTDRKYEIHYENSTTVNEFIHWLETEEEYNARKFNEAKTNKINENSSKCYAKLNSGKFYIEVSNTRASYYYNDSTINNLNASAIGFIAGVITSKQWTDEDGNTVMLSQENVAEMLQTLNNYANPIWDKWGVYKKQIEAATTVAEVEAIIINYEVNL